MPTMPKATRAPWMAAPRRSWTHGNRWEGYNTRKWRELSAAFKQLNPLCATPGCNGATYATDHDRNIASGDVDPYDQSNWRPICKRCHTIKSSKEGGNATAGRTVSDKGGA